MDLPSEKAPGHSPERTDPSDAWGALTERLREFVARRAPGSEVDDLVQVILLKVKGGLPTLRDDERFGPWVYKIARRTMIDEHRRRQRSPATVALNEEAQEAPEPSDEEGAVELLT